jgi:hypothetical protein
MKLGANSGQEGYSDGEDGIAEEVLSRRRRLTIAGVTRANNEKQREQGYRLDKEVAASQSVMG